MILDFPLVSNPPNLSFKKEVFLPVLKLDLLPSLWHMNCCTASFHSLLRDLLRLVCKVGSIAFEIGSRRRLMMSPTFLSSW